MCVHMRVPVCMHAHTCECVHVCARVRVYVHVCYECLRMCGVCMRVHSHTFSHAPIWVSDEVR